MDDELIGCGGAILNHLQKKESVGILYFGAGDIGDIASNTTREQMTAIRRQEAAEVGKALGISFCHFFMLKNEGLLEVTIEQIFVTTQIIRTEQPSIIYLPHQGEEHPDHTAITNAVLKAINLAGMNNYPDLGKRHRIEVMRFYEVWTPLLNCNLFIDITKHATQKLELINIYQSQVKKRNYAKAILALNSYRAEMAGHKDCLFEAFNEIRRYARVLNEQ
jgi:LmbE family N-acetylglucosaminyl deacetylase